MSAFVAAAASLLSVGDVAGIEFPSTGAASSVCADVDATGFGFSMPGGETALRVADDGAAAAEAVSAMISESSKL